MWNFSQTKVDGCDYILQIPPDWEAAGELEQWHLQVKLWTIKHKECFSNHHIKQSWVVLFFGQSTFSLSSVTHRMRLNNKDAFPVTSCRRFYRVADFNFPALGSGASLTHTTSRTSLENTAPLISAKSSPSSVNRRRRQLVKKIALHTKTPNVRTLWREPAQSEASMGRHDIVGDPTLWTPWRVRGWTRPGVRRWTTRPCEVWTSRATPSWRWWGPATRRTTATWRRRMRRRNPWWSSQPSSRQEDSGKRWEGNFHRFVERSIQFKKGFSLSVSWGANVSLDIARWPKTLMTQKRRRWKTEVPGKISAQPLWRKGGNKS